MPNIFIETFEGRSFDEKKELVSKITDVVSKTWDVDKEVVNIRIMENKRENVARGGKMFSER